MELIDFGKALNAPHFSDDEYRLDSWSLGLRLKVNCIVALCLSNNYLDVPYVIFEIDFFLSLYQDGLFTDINLPGSVVGPITRQYASMVLNYRKAVLADLASRGIRAPCDSRLTSIQPREIDLVIDDIVSAQESVSADDQHWMRSETTARGSLCARIDLVHSIMFDAMRSERREINSVAISTALSQLEEHVAFYVHYFGLGPIGKKLVLAVRDLQGRYGSFVKIEQQRYT